MRTLVRYILYGLSLLVSSLPFLPALAQTPQSYAGFFPADPASNKFIGAAIAFGLSAIAAGLAIGRAGSAGLAGTAERPEIRTTAIIITALGEALAIYGIVIAILILGSAA
ncbi:MAG: V-type ATP synthase subunit K [Thaumarchaeota archaeon]|nr:V-type ATP synthase subunit K [Nitrososphaerota archaeon]